MCSHKEDIHRDVKVPMVEDEIKWFADKHQKRLESDENVEVISLLDNGLVRHG